MLAAPMPPPMLAAPMPPPMLAAPMLAAPMPPRRCRTPMPVLGAYECMVHSAISFTQIRGATSLELATYSLGNSARHRRRYKLKNNAECRHCFWGIGVG